MQVTRDEWSLGGIDLTLDDFDRIGSYVPLLVDLHPAGRFLMDDFYRASGLLAAQLNHQASAFGGYVASVSASATATPFPRSRTRQVTAQWLLRIGTGNWSCGFGHRPVECRVEQRLSRPGHEVNCFVTGELSDIG